ncbi:MAG: lysophospholipase [Lachnospiraceae bacterium]|nr:lysophospholipase [Lachnospiraceae bacterium]
MNIHFLGEEDFLPAMEGENRRFRETYVRNDRFTTRDGIRLNYHIAECDHPRGVVVIVHGYCGFFGKYHEYAWYLWQAGFRVFFLEQRCHGYSDGKLPELDVIHIDNFNTYKEDLHEFMEKVVKPASESLPLLMLAHSMGGAVGALYLEDYPMDFRGAILSSPMLKMKTGNYTPFQLKMIKFYMILFSKQKTLSPGQHHFDPTPNFPASSTLSEVRFLYLFGQRLEDIHYQTAGASLGWIMAAVDVEKQILKHTDRIQTPIVLMQAGMDSLVDPVGFDQFMARVPQTKIIVYENSKHELFNAGTDVRKQYFSDVLHELDKFITGS